MEQVQQSAAVAPTAPALEEVTAPAITEPSTGTFWAKVMDDLGGEKTGEVGEQGEKTAEPVVEAPKVEEPAKDADKETLESLDRFKLLTRQEQKNKKMRDDFEAEKKAFEDSKSNYIDKMEMEKLAKEDPLAFAEKYGFDVENAMRRKIGKANNDPVVEIQSLREELKTLKEHINKSKEETIQEQIKREETTNTKHIEDYKSYIGSFVEKNAEKYEYAAELPNVNQEIFEVWYGVAQKTGTPPSLDEIVAKVNDYAKTKFIEQAKASKLLPKLVRELGLVKDEPVKEQPFSLSDKIPSSPAASKPLTDLKRIPTDEERMRDAIEAFEMAKGSKK